MFMIFIALLILTTLSIAGSAAFFSIYGLAQIFTGSFWPVVVMASSLEAGKLVAASYVYRYRKNIGFLMKTYLVVAIIILMGITSAGIFGFLSAAYQQDILPLEQMEQRIVLLEDEKIELGKLKQERLDRKKQIDADIAALPNNYITGRQRLMKSYGPEIKQLKEDIATYTKQLRDGTLQIQTLKSQKLEATVHTGPIVFIAKVFDREVDDATKWLILLIIFAFDPLAVVLTVGTNIAILTRKGPEEVKELVDDIEEVADEPEPAITQVDQLFEQPTAQITVEQIREALEDMNARELTPADIAQKGMLEEMLAKKVVTEKVRNPQKKS